jgi:hypothetical protein
MNKKVFSFVNRIPVFRKYGFLLVVIILFFIINTCYSQTKVSWITDAQQAVDNGTSQDPTSVITYNGSIYWVYVNVARQMVVAKKNGNDVQKHILFNLESPPDERWHICPTIGVDKKGYIHVTGDMHSGSWKYFMSLQPENISSFERRYDLPGSSITYPSIFYDNNHEMFICFRHMKDGALGYHRGGVIRYDADTDVFTMLGGTDYNSPDYNSSDTKKTKTLIWGNGFGGNSADGINFCFYQTPGIRVYFDQNNRMHLIATVINKCIQAPKGYESHTHIIYAYSDDLGNTWHKINGDEILSLPLTVNNASIVIERMDQNDIYGADCELGAFDSNRPIVTFRLSSDNSNHSVMYNGGSWVALRPPRSTNLMVCRPNGYAAWYNGVYIDYTNDGQNWNTIVGETQFPGGIYPDQGGFFDREYFKQTGNIRYHAKFNNYTVSKIFTIFSEIGNIPNAIDAIKTYSLLDIADKEFTVYNLSGISVITTKGSSLNATNLKALGIAAGIYFAVPNMQIPNLDDKAIKVVVF